MCDYMVLGIYRERLFSPGKVDDDAMIMDAVLDELASRGYAISAVRGEELDDAHMAAGCVLNMAESEGTLSRLEGWEQAGTRVINRVSSIRNCLRACLFELLAGAGLPVPGGAVTPAEGVEKMLSFTGGRQYWLKRGDAHSVNPGDVVKVTSREQATRAVGHFMGSGVGQIFVQEHLEGQVVKFYALAGSRFFRAFSSPGKGEEITHRMGQMRILAGRAGEAAGLEVFGGDAVVTPRDEIFLIDLNHWPSFAACRRAAARHIAAYVSECLKL